ncbi:hypothetical protein [Pseudomonas sp. GW531-T4]|uniref:hypothetical protein n=1 Tax=Pseudomonas sp. GW531-T4 TaxID=2075553 RepID=UPI0015B27B62|nr:hypothetical protein [Pseudomonas sp. GW531-T4]
MSSNELSVPRDLLKKWHRDLDACQKAIWLAGGFDPAYCTDAQACLGEMNDLLAVPVSAWNPHPAESNLAALLILLAQSGVNVSGGIGGAPWAVEPVPPAGGERWKQLASDQELHTSELSRKLQETRKHAADAQAALDALKAAQGEPVALTAVGILRDDGDGGLAPEWILEGGTAELWAGAVLLIADGAQDLCAEDGHCDLYREQPAPVADAQRKDAERYQWLRERDLETLHRGGVFAGQTPQNMVLNGKDLDDAIDAAKLGEVVSVPKELMP